MKILIVVNNLSGGGAEKVAVDLANELIQSHKISVLTLSDKDDKFILNDGIHRIKLNQRVKSANFLNGISNNIKRLYKLKKAIVKENPTVVITFMNRTNIRVLLSLLFTKIPVIITEHNYPGLNKMNFFWEILRRFTYTNAFKLVSVSQGISDWFDFLDKSKKVVIYNPTFTSIENNGVKDLSNKTLYKKITAMGRLEKVKGFDILITAFKEVIRNHNEWKLEIIGEGKERKSLQKLIYDLELENSVKLSGFNLKPHSMIQESDIFVLSSRNEGLGNVILEAMKCSVPVISTDCPVGPKEIIDNEVDGILTLNEDVESLSNAMSYLIENKDVREKLVRNAWVKLEKFSNSAIYKQWKELLSIV